MSNFLIEALDNAVAVAGMDVVLSRPSISDSGLTVRASVRAGNPLETDPGVAQMDAWVILPPTMLIEENWPDGGTFGLPQRNDRVTYQGRTRTVEMVRPFYVQNELVRIELGVTG